MKNNEEYIIKNSIDEKECDSIKVDGVYFTTLKERMLNKFRNQPNPEFRVNSICDNALEIFKKIKKADASRNPNERNILLVGKVQSGKTSNMQMAIALAFDNGYDMLVFYGGYDNTLLAQSVSRFSDVFKKPDSMNEEDAKFQWVNIFTTNNEKTFKLNEIDDDVVSQIKEEGGKIIIICLKNSTNINKVNERLERLEESDIKSIIFDDEGDQASLNTEFRKNKKSATYDSIVRMKNILHFPPYMSVTATPQALIFSPDTSYLKPTQLQLIHPGKGYTGLEEFHLNDKHINLIEDELVDYVENGGKVLPATLTTAIKQYLISSALLVKCRVLKSTQMIIHFDGRINYQNVVYDMIYNNLSALQNNIRLNQDKPLNRKLGSFKDIFYNDEYIDPDIRKDFEFDDIKSDLLNVIKSTAVALMNSEGKDTLASIGHKRYTIRVGANLLQRGVSFDQLITTYFTRWPSSHSNMDTQVQRARWLGYRKNFLNYCHIFTTREISDKFQDLAEIESDLWQQMGEVEEGQSTLDSITIDADPKLRPTRRNVANYSCKTFGRKWLNQRIGLHENIDIEHNNNVIERIIDKYDFIPTYAGSTEISEDPITGYHSYISYEDLETLLKKTDGIFGCEPFNGALNILRLAEGRKIDLILLWNYEKVNLKNKDRKLAFGKDIRERAFNIYDGEIKISALQQGADTTQDELKKYKGDKEVYNDSEAITIQVSPIYPKKKKSPEIMYDKFQYMYSIRMPKIVSVYAKGE